MPNFLKKLFGRKPRDKSSEALVQHGSQKRGRAKKQASSRKAGRGAVSTTSSATTAAVNNKTTTPEKYNENVIHPQPSPTGSNDPPGFSRTSAARKSPTTSSTSILHNNPSSPNYEVAHSTTSTAKTSDRDSPTFGVEDSEHPKPRHSPKMANGTRKQEVAPAAQQRVAPASVPPPTRSGSSGGPVDLDSIPSEDETEARRPTGNSAIPVFTMDGGGPSQSAPHLLLHKHPDDVNDGDSSFNISTDAEDTEYENLKRGVPPPTSLDQSGVSSTFNADGDTSVFPNLKDEETPTASEKDFAAAWDTTSPIHSFPQPSGTSSSAGNVPGFPSPRFESSAMTTEPPRQSSSSKQTVQSPASDPFQDGFADFADFANFDSNWDTKAPAKDSKGRSKSERPSSRRRGASTEPSPKVYIDTRKISRSSSSRDKATSVTSTSMSTRETSLTELLAQAKSKSTSRKSNAGSVNSAPVQSSYRRRDGSSVPLKTGPRSIAEGGPAASVSDIIQNLDTAAKSRDGGGSVKSAKERFKSKSRRPKDKEDSDEPTESWLFDEVTGALGPRGIAADLESLSGRSHTSGGGRSHKSHRSSRSKRRNKKHSSGESVNSKDSKNSRRSRSSRYSHRSTRSYISQMSEQSRSVANDLLRLEMQLAMVGQQQGQGSGAAEDKSHGEGGHRSNRSRSSAKSHRSNTSGARRSRITVMAPPGKLGIILANKADSKGTVVSGVRTSSVLAEKINPGDRIVAIDGEDVSLMTVSEITTIMARKADFERTLTVLTAPRSASLAPESISSKYRN
mmetsp:Transcript_29433/g.80851  ORF Transcript_29433/g.80851 Transcript_29433/m.80851 type:complete len:790 (-) Transcript_29433:1402-3771(-)